MNTVIAVFACSVALGTWLGVRWAETQQRLDDIEYAALIMSIDLDDDEVTQ